MSNSSQVQLRLTVRAEDQATEIWVLDDRFRTVDYGLGYVGKPLAPGIYKVRAAAGSATWEQVVVLETVGRALAIPPLRFPSPAPLPNTALTHEYHEAAVEDESCQVHVEAGDGSALFVFVRRWTEPGATTAPRRSLPHPAAGLTVHHMDGRLVADLALQSASYASPLCDAWAACTVRVDPGPYRLRLVLPGDSILEQTLIAAPGWMTQVYALQRSYGPEPGDERADLPGATFVYRGLEAVTGRLLWFRVQDREEREKGVRLSELARQGMMNRRDVLPRDVTEMVWEKWQNPMLGIHGAHLMLLDPEPDWGIFQTVVHNLRRILGPHPDVEALALQREETADWSYRFEVPPTLRRSWELIRQATFAHPELVPSGSLASQVSDRLWGGSLWHLWRGSSVASVLPSSERATADFFETTAPAPPLLDGYDHAIATQLQRIRGSSTPVFWDPELPERLLYEQAQEEPALSDEAMHELMDSVGLPRARVQERVDRLHVMAQVYLSVRSDMPPGLQRTRELEKVVAAVRSEVGRTETTPDIGQYIDEDTEGSRITALGILQVRPDPRFFPFVRSAIDAPRSAFEQFHALMAAQAIRPKLDGDQKLALHTVLRDQRGEGEGQHIRPGTDRWVVSSRILDVLDQDESWMLRGFRPLEGPG